MSDNTQTDAAQAEASATVDTRVELNPEAGLAGAAGFASAESMEILNLLGDTSGAGSCCGGGCCAPAAD